MPSRSNVHFFISDIRALWRSVMARLKNHFVCVSVCHTKRVERSADRNPTPIFTKLATKVESQEMWLPVVFGGIRKTHVHNTGSGIHFHHCSFGKIALMSNISKTVTDTTMGSMEVGCESTYKLWIDTMTFDIG